MEDLTAAQTLAISKEGKDLSFLTRFYLFGLKSLFHIILFY